MTITEGADLHKRVERYEAAVNELQAAYRDVKELLQDQVLFEHWQQLGSELGFAGVRPQSHNSQRDLTALNSQIPEMSESWAG
jgi:hypothetical protein